MPNRNVYLPPDLDDFVLTSVEGGRHSNVSELVQAALRALDREERTHEAKRAALRAAMHRADARSIQEDDVFRNLWLPPLLPPSFPSEVRKRGLSRSFCRLQSGRSMVHPEL